MNSKGPLFNILIALKSPMVVQLQSLCQRRPCFFCRSVCWDTEDRKAPVRARQGLKKYGLTRESAVEIVASDYGVGKAWQKL